MTWHIVMAHIEGIHGSEAACPHALTDLDGAHSGVWVFTVEAAQVIDYHDNQDTGAHLVLGRARMAEGAQATLEGSRNRFPENRSGKPIKLAIVASWERGFLRDYGVGKLRLYFDIGTTVEEMQALEPIFKGKQGGPLRVFGAAGLEKLPSYRRHTITIEPVLTYLTDDQRVSQRGTALVSDDYSTHSSPATHPLTNDHEKMDFETWITVKDDNSSVGELHIRPMRGVSKTPIRLMYAEPDFRGDLTLATGTGSWKDAEVFGKDEVIWDGNGNAEESHVNWTWQGSHPTEPDGAQLS